MWRRLVPLYSSPSLDWNSIGGMTAVRQQLKPDSSLTIWRCQCFTLHSPRTNCNLIRKYCDSVGSLSWALFLSAYSAQFAKVRVPRVLYSHVAGAALWLVPMTPIVKCRLQRHDTNHHTISMINYCVCDFVYACVCPRAKRKTAWAINTEVGGQARRESACRYDCLDFLYIVRHGRYIT